MVPWGSFICRICACCLRIFHLQLTTGPCPGVSGSKVFACCVHLQRGWWFVTVEHWVFNPCEVGISLEIWWHRDACLILIFKSGAALPVQSARGFLLKPWNCLIRSSLASQLPSEPVQLGRKGYEVPCLAWRQGTAISSRTHVPLTFVNALHCISLIVKA